MGIDKSAVALGQRQDAIAVVKLSAQFSRSAFDEIADCRISVLHHDRRTDTYWRSGPNGSDGGISIGRIGQLVGPGQCGVSVFAAPRRIEVLEKCLAIF